MKDEVAVTISGVSKDFKLPLTRVDSLKGLFVHPFQSAKDQKSETHHALKDISFEIKKGEFFGIVGRNGSGKSTLLKIIAGIYQPTAGTVNVNGRLVPFIELGVGFNPELTGKENIYLNGALMGFSTKEIDAMYDDIVSFAELEEFMDQKLKNYSSGMQVRLAFSVATRAKAEVLLIDEVLAVGDADFQRKCFQYFRSLKKQGVTVIFVSHDMEAVREYCDRCILIDHSELVYESTPEVIAEKYVKLFHQDLNQEKKEQQADDSTRWGNGFAKARAIKARVNTHDVVIQAQVVFTKELHDPIVGFLIKNSSGETVCGTNSRILQQRLGTCEAGKVIELEWRMPNIFSDDDYEIESAITQSDGVTQADWWHGAASFSIHNEKSTPHVVSPDISLAVN